MKLPIPSLLLVAVSGALLSGCAGYQLGAAKPAAFAGIEKLHVPPFKNQTLEPRLSSLVTNAVLIKLQSDGTYRVSNKSSADAVLVGTIIDVDKRQLRADRTDTLRSRELNVYLHVEYHLEDPVTGERIDGWRGRGNAEGKGKLSKAAEDDETLLSKPGRVVGETIQFVDNNFQVSERNAIAQAAENAADKIVSQIANGW